MFDQCTAYLAPKDFTEHVEAEIIKNKRKYLQYDRLFVVEGDAFYSYWAQNTWLNPKILPYASVKDASKQLRAIQRNWAPYASILHRRTSLICDELPSLSGKPKVFPFSVPDNPMGSFMLLDEKTMIASSLCTSPFANGEINLEENKLDPPSRAYLKLEEALSLYGKLPNEDSHCVDAGACPGGWTWVLARLGARVSAIDKAPLDEKVSAMKNVRFLQQSAFGLKPKDLGETDFLCSDVICYPEKLYDWVMTWIESGLVKNCICTIKMQGEPDWNTIDRFMAIPGSAVVHLSNNKHELTFISSLDDKNPALPSYQKAIKTSLNQV